MRESEAALETRGGGGRGLLVLPPDAPPENLKKDESTREASEVKAKEKETLQVHKLSSQGGAGHHRVTELVRGGVK